jgi:hypothetical protein
MNQDNVAILWDAENVQPTLAPTMASTIVEFARGHGHVSVQVAFADWTRRNLRRADTLLARESFQLIHVPSSTKNSADISMVTHAIETLFLYPHITTYVLVTGDSDFRPLLQAIRRRGAKSIVICNANNANEELLALSDIYTDYRDLFNEDAAENHQTEAPKPQPALAKKRAFEQLAEAVSLMKQDHKRTSLGAVKIRVKLLNENFDEAELGFPSWKSFVIAARDAGFVEVTERDSDLYLELPDHGPGATADIPEPFATLRKVVAELGGGKERRPVPFSTINNVLISRKCDYQDHGFSRFKKLAEAAEKRGVIELSNEGLEWFARIPG